MMARSKKLRDNSELLGFYPPHISDLPNAARRQTDWKTLPANLVASLARQSDPKTSHEGAAYAVERLGEMQQRAFDAVQAHPGKTAQELEVLMEVPRSTYGRRLGEMEKAGVIRRCDARTCTVTGRKAATWRVA